MTVSTLFLTLDDSPSKHTSKLVARLKSSQMNAVFFCRGEFMAQRPEQVAAILEQGFLIGNHSYTHPYFSQIPLEACYNEILKTEALIDKAYQEVGTPRPKKVVRLPFADRGAGPWAQEASTPEEHAKVQAIQSFLKAEGFEPLFRGSPFVDAFWDWDTQDYKTRFIRSPEDFEHQLKSTHQAMVQPNPVLLIHDFDHNHHLLELTLRFLKERMIKTLPFE